MPGQHDPARARRRSTFFLAFSVTLILALRSSFLSAQQPKFDSVKIDALDPDAWNGLVFLARAYQQPAYFALRVGSRGRSYESGSEIFNYVREIGPHAPDGSYARVGWEQPPRANLVHLEWARVNDTTAVGRLVAPPDVQLVIETYMPFSAPHMSQGRFALAESNQAIVGERLFRRRLWAEREVHGDGRPAHAQRGNLRPVGTNRRHHERDGPADFAPGSVVRGNARGDGGP